MLRNKYNSEKVYLDLDKGFDRWTFYVRLASEWIRFISKWFKYIKIYDLMNIMWTLDGILIEIIFMYRSLLGTLSYNRWIYSS
jgi:hypothetical protein